eukprot:c44546_g1_i1 orf=219-389(-)
MLLKLLKLSKAREYHQQQSFKTYDHIQGCMDSKAISFSPQTKCECSQTIVKHNSLG